MELLNRGEQTQGSGGLALTKWGRCDGRDVDITTIGPFPQAVQDLEMHLGLGGAIAFEFVLPQPEFRRHQPNGLEGGGLGDVQVRGHGHPAMQGGGGKGLREGDHAISFDRSAFMMSSEHRAGRPTLGLLIAITSPCILDPCVD